MFAAANRRPYKMVLYRNVFSMRRDHLYLFGFLLGIANIGFQDALHNVQSAGFLFALTNLFGFSALIWASVAAVVALLFPSGNPAGNPSGLEILIVIATIIACLLPFRASASGATSLLAIIALTTSPWHSPLARSSIITLSCVAALYWGQAVLAISGTLLLDVDVSIAANLSGLDSQGNMLLFASSDPEFAGNGFMVASGCSSLHGISIALLAFVLVTQFYNLPLSLRTVLLGAMGVLGTVAINIARLAIMGYFPKHFEWIHVGAGATIAGFATLVLVIFINMGGNWLAIVKND